MTADDWRRNTLVEATLTTRNARISFDKSDPKLENKAGSYFL